MNEYSDGFTANIEPPLCLEDTASASWHAEADIVVVGFGGAGAVAALQAREDGASVIVLDRFGGGGATANSGGVIYAGGTRFQREAGFEDSADEMFKYLSFEGTPVRDATLRRFCETSSENIEWLGGHGVRFGSTAYMERTAYPPDPYYLYFTGMEKFRAEHARPAPRGHRTVGKGPTGRFYFAALRDATQRSGAHVLLHSPIRRLLLDRDRRVIGIEAQVIPENEWSAHEAIFRKVDPMKPFNGAPAEAAIARCADFENRVPQQRVRIRARKGVILAAGGYNYNLALFSRHAPHITAAYRVLVRGGSMGCDGSGIELGASAGGALDRMTRVFITKAISPPNAFVRGVLVNMEGKRIINEDAYVGNVGLRIAEQSHDGAAWLVLDSGSFWQGLRQLLWPLKNAFSWWGMPALMNVLFGGTRRGRTAADLAGKLGIDAANLQSCLREYDEFARRKKDEDFAKQGVNLEPLAAGPLFAVNMSLHNKFGFSGTMPYGGLTVDEDTGAVTRADGSRIAGLYAAGRSAVGVCSDSNFSGLSIADTVFSGRRAARAAARAS